MTRAAKHDAGLRAVARVRGVRETDSRIGLQSALGELRAAQARVDDLRGRLSSADAFTRGSTASFLALRSSLDALGSVLVEAEAARDQAGTISDAALARWQQDRSRLSAIEMLLDRRAAERRADAVRAETREQDEVAARRWARANRGEGR
jgi:flagellar export protein FliJ